MKQPLKYTWMTPFAKEGKPRNCVALFRWGDWIETYQGEALMCHPDYKHELSTYFMRECEGPKIYATIPEALEAKDNMTMMKGNH